MSIIQPGESIVWTTFHHPHLRAVTCFNSTPQLPRRAPSATTTNSLPYSRTLDSPVQLFFCIAPKLPTCKSRCTQDAGLSVHLQDTRLGLSRPKQIHPRSFSTRDSPRFSRQRQARGGGAPLPLHTHASAISAGQVWQAVGVKTARAERVIMDAETVGIPLSISSSASGHTMLV